MNFMKTKRMIIVLVIAVFTLGVAGLGFSGQEIKGTVAKIKGNQLTIQDDAGKQITFEVTDPNTIPLDLKVGGTVVVTQDGNNVKIIKKDK